jgi:peptidoglycan/LPS O-acetylase OafA/YrhL
MTAPTAQSLPATQGARATGMPGPLSAYLDLVRLSAAFLVFLMHSHYFLTPQLTYFVSYGRESVAIFFVLSGFVIAFVSNEKETDWRDYAVARISRIYSVAIPAIVVTIIADAIGTAYNLAAYKDLIFYRQESIDSILSYLLFANQLWFRHVVLGVCEPYWSLGFEVWYYIIFGLYFYIRPARAKYLLVVLALLICGPKITMYLPLWLLGCLAYAVVKRDAVSRQMGVVFYVLSTLLLVFLFKGLYKQITPTDMYRTYALTQEISNFAYFHILGVLVAINIVAFAAMTRNRRFWRPGLERKVRWAASASFTLYLAHQPIEVMISAVWPQCRDNLAYGLIALAATLLFAFALAEVTERRKKLLAGWIAPLFAAARRRPIGVS